MKTIILYNQLKKPFLLFFVVFFGTQILHSQTIPEVLWAKRYGGTGSDVAHDYRHCWKRLYNWTF